MHGCRFASMILSFFKNLACNHSVLKLCYIFGVNKELFHQHSINLLMWPVSISSTEDWCFSVSNNAAPSRQQHWRAPCPYLWDASLIWKNSSIRQPGMRMDVLEIAYTTWNNLLGQRVEKDFKVLFFFLALSMFDFVYIHISWTVRLTAVCIFSAQNRLHSQ